MGYKQSTYTHHQNRTGDDKRGTGTRHNVHFAYICHERYHRNVFAVNGVSDLLKLMAVLEWL